MKKQALLYSSIIIVFIICGILYINNKVAGIGPLSSEMQTAESSIQYISNDIELEGKEEKIEIKDTIEEKGNAEEKDFVQKEPVFCTVYICGAVREPNVYTLREGSRINDVLNIAGGALEEADLNQLNLAEKIVDSQKIYVPKIGEEIDKSLLKVENREETVVAKETNNGQININTASKEQLQILSGIGEVIAQNIIEYRETNGSFSTIEEIQNVSRIGEKTFQKIKDKITVY